MNVGARETTRPLAGVPELPGPGVIRIVRYSVYPRAACEDAVQTAFTRGAGGNELQLVTSTPAAVGELLRIQIQDLRDGEACDALARVVSCTQLGEGRFELGVDALDAGRPRFARNPA